MESIQMNKFEIVDVPGTRTLAFQEKMRTFVRLNLTQFDIFRHLSGRNSFRWEGVDEGAWNVVQ